MVTMNDHPLRYAAANELHARPFPTVAAPGWAVFLAIKPTDADAARAHLLALLDRFGAQHPQPDATHYFGTIGKYRLKWESHTEFVTYTVIGHGVSDRAFDPAAFDVLPQDWLAATPGTRVTSALIRIEIAANDDGILDKVHEWLVPESLAISHVLENELVIAGDFRIDPAGHMRFALFARPDVGARRIGRVLQRLCEIETYKAMSMLGLCKARDLGPAMADIDRRLTGLLQDMQSTAADADAVLQSLLSVSAEIENTIARSSFRFSATSAYEKLVNQRIAILREERFEGRQTFGEFMMRRFDPAMRTVKSVQSRLQALSDRALRAGDLLRTRVDVARSAQNQALLQSMDRRADLQLRLQHTVEGLSVVAISYYAVNLALYALGPLGEAFEIGKAEMAAVATPVVLVLVWAGIRRIRKHMA